MPDRRGSFARTMFWICAATSSRTLPPRSAPSRAPSLSSWRFFPNSETRNPKQETRSPKSPKPETRNPTPETRNPYPPPISCPDFLYPTLQTLKPALFRTSDSSVPEEQLRCNPNPQTPNLAPYPKTLEAKGTLNPRSSNITPFG